MQMMTKEIEKNMPALYSTEEVPLDEKKIAVKFFCPWNHWTWYAFEGEKQADGDWLFFGQVEGDFAEMGEFLLSELESVRGPMGLKIERDLHISKGRTYGEVKRV